MPTKAETLDVLESLENKYERASEELSDEIHDLPSQTNAAWKKAHERGQIEAVLLGIRTAKRAVENLDDTDKLFSES